MLFKILHGDDAYISLDIVPFHEGYCYVTYGGNMYVDMNTGTASEPNNQRIQLNAANAQTLCGMTLEEIKASIDSSAIVDVEELPSAGINTMVLYRLKTEELALLFQGEYYKNGETFNGTTLNFIVVDTLPNIGEPYMDNVETPTKGTFYLQKSDNGAYAYISSEMAEVMPFAEGWISLAEMIGGVDHWGGVISSENQATDSTKLYAIYKILIELYHYKDGWHKVGSNEGITETRVNELIDAAINQVLEGEY